MRGATSRLLSRPFTETNDQVAFLISFEIMSMCQLLDLLSWTIDDLPGTGAPAVNGL